MSHGSPISWLPRAGALALAVGFLGVSMLRASAGCANRAAPISAEAPAETTASPPEPRPASDPPPAAPPRAASDPPTATAAPRAPAKPAAKASAPRAYFPGTKAAPMSWPTENAVPQAAQR
jgi:hypothetical protein